MQELISPQYREESGEEVDTSGDNGLNAGLPDSMAADTPPPPIQDINSQDESQIRLPTGNGDSSTEEDDEATNEDEDEASNDSNFPSEESSTGNGIADDYLPASATGSDADNAVWFKTSSQVGQDDAAPQARANAEATSSNPGDIQLVVVNTDELLKKNKEKYIHGSLDPAVFETIKGAQRNAITTAKTRADNAHHAFQKCLGFEALFTTTSSPRGKIRGTLLPSTTSLHGHQERKGSGHV